MTPSKALQIEHLYLHNFRCFETCTMTLDPQLSVLVAENGGGKTAVLDALAIALGLFVDNVSGTKQNIDFEQTDLRLVPGENGLMTQESQTEFMVRGYVTEQFTTWSASRTNSSTRSRAKGAKELVGAARQLRERVQNQGVIEDKTPAILPLVAFYGTERLWREQPTVNNKKERDRIGSGRMAGYTNCLASSSSVKDVIEWYETKMTEAGDSRYSTQQPAKLVSAVEKAMQVVLEPSGWCKLGWDYDNKTLIVGHSEQGWMPLSVLSDGVRTMVALAMDIARRCASLNPHLGEEAAEKTPGILIIDEVDMHLHPRWQQEVVTLLRKAFPAVQLILSTHSPQVLSAVDRKFIRVIRLHEGKGSFEMPWFQTRGVQSADALAFIMGVDPVPPVEEARWLNDYRALIEEGQSETPTAQQLRRKLEMHFGVQHPVIQDCDRIIRLERFKKSLPPHRGQAQE